VMDLRINIDAKSVIKNLNKVIAEHPKAVARALNDMAKQGMNESIRLAQDKYTVKSTVRKYFEISRASANKLISKIYVKKRSGKYSIGLVYFKHSGTKRGGVTVERTRGKSIRFRHAFRAAMPSGHKGIWVRTKEKSIPTRGRYAGKYEREKIKELFGPTVFTMFKSADVMSPLKQFISSKLPVLVQRHIDKEIKGIIK